MNPLLAAWMIDGISVRSWLTSNSIAELFKETGMGGSKPLTTQRVVFGLLGYVVLAVPFLAGWLGAYVSPFQLWWLQPLATILPFTMAVFCGSALLGFLLFKPYWRTLLVLYLPLLLLAFARFIPGIEQGFGFISREYGSLDKDKFLEVMTFNAGSDRVIWKYVWRGNAPWRVLSERHRMYLKAGLWEQPHISCIQEASEEIKKEWPTALYDTDARLALLPGRGLERMGSSTIVDNSSPLQANAVRPSTFVIRDVYHWRGQTIAVFNVQLHSFSRKPWQGSLRRWQSIRTWLQELITLRQDYLIRAHEAQQLRLMLEKEELPFIVCGDFNSTPHEWSYVHVAQGLRKASGWGQATYPYSHPLFKIDHVLVSREWKVIAMNRIDTMISDHLPVLATLALLE